MTNARIAREIEAIGKQLSELRDKLGADKKMTNLKRGVTTDLREADAALIRAANRLEK